MSSVAGDGKEFPLSIVVKSVDKATEGLRKINERIEALTKPIRQVNESVRSFGKEAGLGKVAAGFRGVGREVKSLTKGIAGIAAAAGLSAAALKGMVDEGAQLARTADRLKVPVDALAQLRHAATQTGVDVGSLDGALEELSIRLGEAKAGEGSLFSFLSKSNPALLAQLTATKDSHEAFLLLADAIAEVEDPTKRAALASAGFSDQGVQLLNLMQGGAGPIRALMQEYFALAGSQEGAARSSLELAKEIGRVGAAFGGIKASILQGLAPAFLDLAEQLQGFFKENRGAIAAWAADFGERLPERIGALVDAIGGLIDFIKPLWDFIGGLSGAATILAAILGGKLVMAVYTLSTALLTTPIGWVIGGIAALIAIGVALVKNWDHIVDFFEWVWGGIKSALATFWEWGKTFFLNFTPAGLIIKYWEPLTGFFQGLWDGITGIFEWAWEEVIKPIVDKVLWAANKVRDVKEFFTGPETIEGSSLIRSSLSQENLARFDKILGRPPASEARIKVDITGAPRGTRTEIDPNSNANVDLSVGQQLVPAP